MNEVPKIYPYIVGREEYVLSHQPTSIIAEPRRRARWDLMVVAGITVFTGLTVGSCIAETQMRQIGNDQLAAHAELGKYVFGLILVAGIAGETRNKFFKTFMRTKNS